MNNNSDYEKNKEFERFMIFLILGTVGFVSLGFILSYRFFKEREHLRNWKAGVFLLVLSAVFFGLYIPKKEDLDFLFQSSNLLVAIERFSTLKPLLPMAFVCLSFWSACAFLTLLVSPLIFWEKKTGRITTRDFKKKKVSFRGFQKAFHNPDQTPLGISLKTKKKIFLPTRQRLEHTLVSGATGMGKTTLMLNFLRHAFINKHPVIIIDPKGEQGDISFIQQMFLDCGRKKEDFELFSLAQPDSSFGYNPLLKGTAQQIRAKIMDGLELNHEYYKAVSGQILSTLITALKVLKKPVSFKILHRLLTDNESIEQLKEDLSQSQVSDSLTLIKSINSFLPFDKRDISGLVSQIDLLNCYEFKGLLSPKDRAEIVLSDTIKNNKVAYFQMNVNGYGDISKRIGKMIVQDLKVLSSQIHANQVDFQPRFVPCFIDEFGSFASADFSDFLKQVRSAGIGVHLFFQTLADLKLISHGFEEQVFGNTATKIIFRQDVPNDVEKWSKTAGTKDEFSYSYQVSENTFGQEKTGLGNQTELKKMRVEHDVFKKLSCGEAVLIDKKTGKEDLFKVFDPKSLEEESIF